MLNPVYNLPELNFVAGESQTFVFNLYDSSGRSFDVNGCDVAFSMVNYANKIGSPIITKYVEASEGKNGAYNMVVVNLLPEDTVGLYGRYVYQISIKDAYGETDIPGHGILNITKNIHQSFISK